MFLRNWLHGIRRSNLLRSFATSRRSSPQRRMLDVRMISAAAEVFEPRQLMSSTPLDAGVRQIVIREQEDGSITLTGGASFDEFPIAYPGLPELLPGDTVGFIGPTPGAPAAGSTAPPIVVINVNGPSPLVSNYFVDWNLIQGWPVELTPSELSRARDIADRVDKATRRQGVDITHSGNDAYSIGQVQVYAGQMARLLQNNNPYDALQLTTFTLGQGLDAQLGSQLVNTSPKFQSALDDLWWKLGTFAPGLRDAQNQELAQHVDQFLTATEAVQNFFKNTDFAREIDKYAPILKPTKFVAERLSFLNDAAVTARVCENALNGVPQSLTYEDARSVVSFVTRFLPGSHLIHSVIAADELLDVIPGYSGFRDGLLSLVQPLDLTSPTGAPNADSSGGPASLRPTDPAHPLSGSSRVKDLQLQIVGRQVLDDAQVTQEGSSLVLRQRGAVVRRINAEFVRSVTFDGGDGNDKFLNGTAFDATLLGGAGNDTLVGGSGQDEVLGDVGADQLFGGAGNDHLVGADDNDVLFGDAGRDSLDGGRGNDSLEGGDGADLLEGGDDADKLLGNAGADSLKGGSGNDELFGASGTDVLEGGDGADVLHGGRDNDTLDGGADVDHYYGGLGKDTAATDGHDGIIEGIEYQLNFGPGGQSTTVVRERADGLNPESTLPDPDESSSSAPPTSGGGTAPTSTTGSGSNPAAPVAEEHPLVDLAIVRNDADKQNVGWNTTQRTAQTLVDSVKAGAELIYFFLVKYEGTEPGRLIITGSGRDDLGYVDYFDDDLPLNSGNNITSAVTRDGWFTPEMRPGDTVAFRAHVHLNPSVPGGTVKPLIVTARQLGHDERADTVQANVVAVANSGPVVEEVGSIILAPNETSRTVSLKSRDLDGDRVTFEVGKVFSSDPDAKRILEQFGITAWGNDESNDIGLNIRWLVAGNQRYYLIPNGELHRANGGPVSWTAGPTVAQLNPRYYQNPDFLFRTAAGTATVNGDQLTVTRYPGFVGQFLFYVYGNDGGSRYGIDVRVFGTEQAAILEPIANPTLPHAPASLTIPVVLKPGFESGVELTASVEPSTAGAAPDAVVSLNDGQLKITPLSGFSGTFQVNVMARREYQVDRQTISVTVTNHAPELAPIAPIRVRHEDSTVQLRLTTSDADNDVVSLSVHVPQVAVYPGNAAQALRLVGLSSQQNILGLNERDLLDWSGTGIAKYGLLPDGRLIDLATRETLHVVPTSYYQHPELLLGGWITPATATLDGNRLTVALQDGFDGTFQVIVQAADGYSTTEQKISLTRNSLPTQTLNGLDENFGQAGFLRNSQPTAQTLLIQPDGKLVTAGARFSMTRYLAEGSLDTSFGSGGIVLSNSWSPNSSAQAILRQGDRYLVAGSDFWGESTLDDMTLLGLDLSGSRDFGFGDHGRVHFGQRYWCNDTGWDLAALPDGSIVMVGHGVSISNGEDFFVLRYTRDGQLLKMASINVEGSFDNAVAVAVQADGKIVVAGDSWDQTRRNTDFSLVRLHSDLSLDTTFGNGGIVHTDFGGEDQIRDLALQPDGKIVAAGMSDGRFGRQAAFARYLPNGQLDPSFGQAGRFASNLHESSYVSVNSLLIRPNGAILAAGQLASRAGLLLQLTPDGQLDNTFGDGGGYFLTQLPDESVTFNSVALQANGAILVAGGVNGQQLLARFAGDGTGVPLNYAPKLGTLSEVTMSSSEQTREIELPATDRNHDSLTFAAIASTIDGQPSAVQTYVSGNRVSLMVPRGFVGEAVIQVSVSDGKLSDSDQFRFQVLNGAPAAEILPVLAGVEGTPLHLAALVGDPDLGDSLAVRWEIRDALGDVIQQAYSEEAEFNPLDEGVYEARVIATDLAGAVGQDVRLLVVSNAAPSADAGEDIVMNAGSGVSLYGSFDDEGRADLLSLSWTVTDIMGQIVATGSGDQLDFAPEAGRYIATFTVTDDDGATSTDSRVIDVLAVSEPTTPDADTEAMPISDDQGLVLNEDSDVEIQLTGTALQETDLLTYRLLDLPSFGTIVSFDPQTGIAVYRPQEDYAGSDSFTFAVNDGNLDGTIGTVDLRIDPVNDAPVALASAFVNEDEMSLIDLSQLVWDAETPSDQLIFTLLGATNGTATLLEDGYTVLFTPDADYRGPAELIVTATDAGQASDDEDEENFSPSITSEPLALLIDVLPVNEAPIAYAMMARLNEDGSVIIQLEASDSDDDPLTYSLTSTPANGEVVEFDPETGLLVYQPHENFVGWDELSFAVSDGEFGSDNMTVTIKMDAVNDAPVVLPPVIEVNEDTAVTIDLWDSVTDLESSTAEMSFSIGPATNGTVTLLPDGHTVVFLPNRNYFGEASFEFSVTDGGELDGDFLSAPITVNSMTATITVLPVNDAPLALNSLTSVREDGVVTLTLASKDDDGDPLTFEITTAPTHGQFAFDEESGTIRYVPQEGYSGSDRIQFRVTDGEFTSTIATSTINVSPLQSGFQLENGRLTIIGTKGNDSIRLDRTAKGYNVVTSFGKYTVANRIVVSSIEVHGRAGNDTINLSVLESTKSADVFGGAGNDIITGGSGNDVLDGGDGNDKLTGGAGHDLLIGGRGGDNLTGSVGNDILLAGVVEDLLREVDLRAILNATVASAPADQLEALDELFSRIVDDGVRDTLTGSVGRDVFITHKLDRLVDASTRDDLTIRI